MSAWGHDESRSHRWHAHWRHAHRRHSHRWRHAHKWTHHAHWAHHWQSHRGHSAHGAHHRRHAHHGGPHRAWRRGPSCVAMRVPAAITPPAVAPFEVATHFPAKPVISSEGAAWARAIHGSHAQACGRPGVRAGGYGWLEVMREPARMPPVALPSREVLAELPAPTATASRAATTPAATAAATAAPVAA